MQVKDIIAAALRLVGLGSTADALNAGEELSSGDSETVTAFLYCFNAVEDEVARCYLPLKCRETLNFNGGELYYSAFGHTPVRIRKIVSGAGNVPYELYPRYIRADCEKAEVHYEYSPSKKGLNDESDFTESIVGEYLLACGAASEYCLLNGEIEAAQLWESRYRAEIDAAQRKALPKGYMPLRRWV